MNYNLIKEKEKTFEEIIKNYNFKK